MKMKLIFFLEHPVIHTPPPVLSTTRCAQNYHLHAPSKRRTFRRMIPRTAPGAGFSNYRYPCTQRRPPPSSQQRRCTSEPCERAEVAPLH